MENWKLTETEVNSLTEENKKKYNKAVEFKGHDWAQVHGEVGLEVMIF